MSMEEFVDFIEEPKEELLSPEEIAEDEETFNRLFEEDNFVPEDVLPSDWYLF